MNLEHLADEVRRIYSLSRSQAVRIEQLERELEEEQADHAATKTELTRLRGLGDPNKLSKELDEAREAIHEALDIIYDLWDGGVGYLGEKEEKRRRQNVDDWNNRRAVALAAVRAAKGDK